MVMSQACHERTVQARSIGKAQGAEILGDGSFARALPAGIEAADRSTENGTLLEMCYPAMGSKP
jgi:hypothetical protein